MCDLRENFGFLDKNDKNSRLMNVLLVLLFGCLLVLPAKAEYGGGTGEPNDPYLIYTAEQMNKIGSNTNDWDKHFKLMDDISLSTYRGTDFNVIGTSRVNAFTGVIDGNNKKISNFNYTSENATSIGLFGYVVGGLIKDLGLINSNLDIDRGNFHGCLVGNFEGGAITGCYVENGNISGRDYIGGLVGSADGDRDSTGTITNCHVTGSVSGDSDVGVLIGSNGFTIDNCSASGEVIGRDNIGGLAGSNSGTIKNSSAEARTEGSSQSSILSSRDIGGLVGYNTGQLAGCSASGEVLGDSRVGGLVGYSYTSSIIACYATGSVSGYEDIGGLLGINRGGIIDSYSLADVEADYTSGGLVGDNQGSVVNCYCSGTITARDQIGGLVGINSGIITASYSSAAVSGRYEVGGLVGFNSGDGEIVDCYASGNVTGYSFVGGLVGNNLNVSRMGFILYGIILNCYSVAHVSGDYYYIGGLVGSYEDDGISGSFWDIQTSGQVDSHAGVSKTTLEMQDPQTFIDAGWDFVGAPDKPGYTWAEPEGGGYPVLKWQISPPTELPAFSGGTGEIDDPHLISTAQELNSIGDNPGLMSAHFKLINNIDLAGVDFRTIASEYFRFQGVFDGNDHTISNFSFTSAEASAVGLFRYVSNGRISNLGLIAPDVHVDAGNFHGSLVGLLTEGTVTNCYVESGSVTGQDETGGLVGENGSGGLIMNCYFTGDTTGRDSVGGLVGNNLGSIKASYSYSDVEGRNAVGGLVGRCAPGEAVNCYARGNVTGEWYVGGLVGSNGSGRSHGVGNIHNCYSASANLTGKQKGGLLGADWGGAIKNCFWDIETCGLIKSYGGEDKTTAEMQMVGTFLNAGWDFAGETDNGMEDIWWILEGLDYPRLWWESP